MTVVVPVPGCKVVSEANQRVHWATRKRRFDTQAAFVRVALAGVPTTQRDALRRTHFVSVRLVRTGGRKLDRDNLAGAFKAVLDEVCRWLERDDGDEERVGLAWAQEPGGVVGVRIELHSAGSPAGG